MSILRSHAKLSSGFFGPGGTPKDFYEASKHVKKSFNSSSLQQRPDPKDAVSSTEVIPLITTFNNHSRVLNAQIKHNFRVTQMMYVPLRDFSVVSAYRKNKNLKDLLVRADVSTGLDQTFPVVSQHFSQPKVQWIGSKVYILPLFVNLQTENLIYRIHCTHCKHNYIGETHHTTLKQHLYNIRRQHLDTPLVKHFSHIPISHFKISVLESNITWSTQQRRRREAVWIRELDSTFPRGFNVR